MLIRVPGAALILLVLSSSSSFAQGKSVQVSAKLTPLNELRLQIFGEPGSLYRIESSLDSKTWYKTALTINESGFVSYSEPASFNTNGKFFRVAIDSASHRIVESYCSRAKITAPQAKLDVYQFIEGLDELGLMTNLVDFAFFCRGMQPAAGHPVSWQNTGVVVGSIERLRGGFALPNYLTTNHFFFTNLPATPQGRTLVLWAAGNMNESGLHQDAEVAVVELAAEGSWPQAMMQMLFSSGGYMPYSWNGTVQKIEAQRPWYGYSGTENSLFCLGMSSSAAGTEICLKRDSTILDDFDWIGSDNTEASPAVIRFGVRSHNQPTTGWNGIYRGFAFFNTALKRAQVMRVNSLLPRVGMIIEGESKTTFTWPYLYWQWWMNTRETWGIYSLRAMSAESGTRVAQLNSLLPNSMEARFPAVAALKTNSQFPVILYSLRGGHNDFIDFELATQAATDNAFTAITNLWAKARGNGFQVVGWTIDRTYVTWSGGIPGNSNMLTSLNNRLRAHKQGCDFFVDNEDWYVSNFGETPYLNSLLYSDGVHDRNAAPYLGTNMLGNFAWPGLGYDLPSLRIDNIEIRGQATKSLKAPHQGAIY